MQGHKYSGLRKRLHAAGYSAADVGHQLNLSQQAVSARLCGKTPWTIDEAYAVMLMIGADVQEMPTLFPPYGDESKAWVTHKNEDTHAVVAALNNFAVELRSMLDGSGGGASTANM